METAPWLRATIKFKCYYTFPYVETCMVFWKLQQGPLGVDFVMERYGEHKCSPSHESRVESTIIKCFYSEPAESKSISDFCPPKILIHIVTKYNHASPFQQSIA